MAKPLVSDELWAVIEPLLPPDRDGSGVGRWSRMRAQILLGALMQSFDLCLDWMSGTDAQPRAESLVAILDLFLFSRFKLM
jgi:transposase